MRQGKSLAPTFQDSPQRTGTRKIGRPTKEQPPLTRKIGRPVQEQPTSSKQPRAPKETQKVQSAQAKDTSQVDELTAELKSWQEQSKAAAKQIK